ncbi:MAG: thermonuclease family protein [Acidobacteriota bacterium]
MPDPPGRHSHRKSCGGCRRYGRIVGKVVADGKDICIEQLRAGLAWFYREYQNELSEEDRRAYADAEAEAKVAKRGLWADANPTPPWDFRRGGQPSTSVILAPKPPELKEDLKEETVYITRTGEKYHRDSCRYLSRSKIAIKRKDAVARGYTPCSVCKP